MKDKMQFPKPPKTINISSLKIKTIESKQKSGRIKRYALHTSNSLEQRGSIFKTNTNCRESSVFGGRTLLKMEEMIQIKSSVDNVTHY